MSVDLEGDFATNHLYDPHSQYVFGYDHHHQPMLLDQHPIESENITMHCSTLPSTVNNHEDDTNEYCQICGDLASGWHCGAVTCEACKKFFLRSLSIRNDGRKKYQCQKDYRCIITKRSRTQCQYCRLAKCLAVGMKMHESTGTKGEDLYKKLPCVVCGASASGIHFGAVTCEACKGFFRRSIKENAPERYHCSENNCCAILANSKITCRSCRFEKCLQVGMSIDASRIGRQSNLFKQSIRQIQNGSTSMATMNDSVRIATMAKKRKLKTQSKKAIFLSKVQIDLELHPSTKEFIDQIYDSYLKYLKNFPPCISYETIWLTMTSQMMNYAQLLIQFCQMTIPNFPNLHDNYEIISSSIHSIVMLILFQENHSSTQNNYWKAEAHVTFEFHRYLPQLKEIEQLYAPFQSKLKSLQLDEREFSLLLLMILTRTNLNLAQDDNQLWLKFQFECVQTFSHYCQVRRSTRREEAPLEFCDIAFFVSQLRSLNRRCSQYFALFPWSSVANLPPFFYRIFVPNE